MSNQNPNPCCKCTDPQYYVTLNTQGPQGRQGQNGVDGFSPTINIVYNTPSQYVLSITDINGTKRTPNLKASLPQGGYTGQVLTKYGNNDGQYTWQNLPDASDTDAGITRYSTLDDFSIVDGDFNQASAITPAGFVELLNNIPDDLDDSFNNANQIARLNAEGDFAINGNIRPLGDVYLQSSKGIYALNWHIGSPPANHSKLGVFLQIDDTKINIGSVVDDGRLGNYTLDTHFVTDVFRTKETVDYRLIDASDIATTTNAGIVKPDGTTITIDADGTLHGASTYNLPTASATVLGGIKVGDGLSITDEGVLSTTGGGGGTSLENVSAITDGISIGNQDAVTTGYKSKVEITGSNKTNTFPIPTIGLLSTQYGGGFELAQQGIFLGVNKSNKLSIFSSDPNNIPSTGDFTLSSIDLGVDVSAGTSKFYINSTTTDYQNGRPVGTNSDSLLPQTGALKYWKGTAEEYTAIATKNVDTLYNVTDTQQVYLGTIKLTGGGNVTPSIYAGIPAGGQNTGYVGTNTVTTYDPPTT